MTNRTELLNIKEAASYLRLSPGTLRNLVWRNEIEHVKIRRRVFLERKTLDEMIEKGRVPVFKPKTFAPHP